MYKFIQERKLDLNQESSIARHINTYTDNELQPLTSQTLLPRIKNNCKMLDITSSSMKLKAEQG